MYYGQSQRQVRVIGTQSTLRANPNPIYVLHILSYVMLTHPLLLVALFSLGARVVVSTHSSCTATLPSEEWYTRE